MQANSLVRSKIFEEKAKGTVEMPRGAQVTCKTHPMREQIDTELLAGKTPADIARSSWLNPKLSRQAIWGYWVDHVKPRLGANTSILKALQDNGLLSEAANVERVGKELERVTGAALLADPYRARIAQHQATADRAMVTAEANGDGRTVAALISTDLKGLELDARLTGRLDTSASPSVSIIIQVPQAQAATVAQQAADGEIIDIG
jgi:hypothetical protein